MRIRVLSDLHFEFHADGGKSFVDSLDPVGTDLLVLAGDITNGQGLRDALNFFHGRFLCPIVYVHGNHEFYTSNRNSVMATTLNWMKAHPRVHFLDNDVLEIGGHRILGTTLWFERSPLAVYFEALWSDFKHITNLNTWVYEENAKAKNFLQRELQENDIVVTHYVPSFKSVPALYERSPMNCYFVTNTESLIVDRKPKLWIHGHTHGSFDYKIGPTRVVCNPFGYVSNEENATFEFNKIIEV